MKDLAIVFALHANPAIGMSSLVSTFIQGLERHSYDVHFVHHVGPDRRYPELEGRGINDQLSPYDPRVEDILDRMGLSHWKIYSHRDWTFVRSRAQAKVRDRLSAIKSSARTLTRRRPAAFDRKEY